MADPSCRQGGRPKQNTTVMVTPYTYKIWSWVPQGAQRQD